MQICKKPKKAKLLFGSGGSKTVIAITDDNQVYKYFPIISHPNNINQIKSNS